MKKNIKTKIAATILASATAFSTVSPAMAAGVTDLYEKYFNNDTSIDIVYNGDVLTYQDVEPQIINDRTMIPFRAVLETMGATVSYDDATRSVTATRDETTIKFSLDSNVIDIDENGTASKIEMDVPMTVVNDRTLVPVRFISNALGMNVGWDADLRTVVIIDIDGYVNQLKALPNFGKLMTMKNEIPAISNGAFTIALDFSMVEKDATGAVSELAFDVKLDTAYDIAYTGGVMGGKAAINLDIDGLNSLIKSLGEADIDLKNIENATIDVVADEGVVYFKTDLIEKIAAAYPDIPKIGSVAQFVDKNTWCKWDMAKTFNDLAKEDPEAQPMADLINGGFSGINNMTVEDIFKMIMDSGEVSLSDAASLDMVAEVYAMMDKYLVVNVEENGDYTIALNMTADDLVNIIIAMVGEAPTAEDMKMFKDMFNFNVKVEGARKDGKITSSLNYEIGINYIEDGEGVKMTLKMISTEAGDMNGKASKPEVPKSALDVMDAIKLLED